MVANKSCLAVFIQWLSLYGSIHVMNSSESIRASVPDVISICFLQYPCGKLNISVSLQVKTSSLSQEQM